MYLRGVKASRLILKRQKKTLQIYVIVVIKQAGLPLGIPHGAFVLELSKKSRSYFRAGGNVSATCPSEGEATKTTPTKSKIGRDAFIFHQLRHGRSITGDT